MLKELRQALFVVYQGVRLQTGSESVSKNSLFAFTNAQRWLQAYNVHLNIRWLNRK